MNTGKNEHDLRELAYRIWEAEGCPPGQAERHWQMALEQARMEQESYTTGENFLGETIASENLVQDERQYGLQNNPFDQEVTQTTMEAEGVSTAQQSLDAEQSAKSSSKRKTAKSKSNETFASQDTGASTRGKSGKRKSSDNILV